MSQPPDDGPPPPPPTPPPTPPAYDPFVAPGTGPTHPAPPPAYGQPAFGPPAASGQPPAYPGYGYGYGYQPEPERKPGTDGFAVASLVLGIIGTIPLAVIFGIVALRRIGRTRQGGKGLAVAGLVISGVWLLVVGAAIAAGVAGGAHRNNGTITTAGRIAAIDLKVGDCIQYPANTSSITAFDAVPCSTPHDAEAYATGDVPLTGDWPGESAMQEATDRQCADAFQAFVGISIDDTALEVTYFYPQQRAWENGQRGYQCVIATHGTKTTGTLRGAAR